MSKLGPMKSLPGWVSQKRSQVQEGKNSPVAAPGENMEFQERDAGSIGTIQPPTASIAYEHHLTPREDGFLWGQSSLTLPFSLEHLRVFGEHNHLTGHHLRCLVIISGGYHLGQGSTTSGPGANSSPLPVFQIKFYWHRATPNLFTYWIWLLSHSKQQKWAVTQSQKHYLTLYRKSWLAPAVGQILPSHVPQWESERTSKWDDRKANTPTQSKLERKTLEISIRGTCLGWGLNYSVLHLKKGFLSFLPLHQLLQPEQWPLGKCFPNAEVKELGLRFST